MKKMSSSNIAQNLKIYRKKKNFTQWDLQYWSKVKLTTISKIETGAIKNPKIDGLIKMAHALDITVNDLLV